MKIEVILQRRGPLFLCKSLMLLIIVTETITIVLVTWGTDQKALRKKQIDKILLKLVR